ncbi:hypothetical protein BDR26DRAFT_946087 [Obelidium mucronatum]|nr:hypothetical protein BDR26DRAFT_946087 [Obelidium mucronatum]
MADDKAFLGFAGEAGPLRDWNIDFMFLVLVVTNRDATMAHHVGNHRGSAIKPFITEYKLAFKDPTPFLRKGTQPGSKKKALAAKQEKAAKDKERALAKASAEKNAALREAPKPKEEKIPINPLLSKRKDIWGPPVNAHGDSTSLTLPAMLPPQQHANTFRRRRVLAAQNISTVRYNIISGQEIGGEPYSGFKEGRRAVIQTFARIDLTTNARTPGYNIISNRDYELDEQMTQQLHIH